jgi:omega-6 fatty acid desaturase (delta-12 desaturase)
VTVAAPLGMWMFYVQHQFEDTYWERSERWDFVRSALEGSSYYQLPKFFQWCTGNVGLHHVHHLAPKVPNYYLQRCHEAIPELRAVRPLRFLESLGALRLRLWDEQRRKMVGFRHHRRGVHRRFPGEGDDQIPQGQRRHLRVPGGPRLGGRL